jgi:hypothetical protein
MAHLPLWIQHILDRGLLPRKAGIWFTKRARRAEERRGARARRRLLDAEGRLGELLAFSGHGE